MGIKVANNANATLAASITSSATSITVTSGQGARFPTLSGSDYFYATLIDVSNNLEIVKVTARSTDVLTVVRAQESTTARAYSTGDRIELRLTAQTFLDATAITPAAVSDQANTSTGYLDLPSGTTAQRPASPNGGMLRHNTTTGYVEYYDPTSAAWIGLGAFQASGGTEVTYTSGSTNYKAHIFTASGTFNVLAGVKNVDYLIVAGGGGGGTDSDVGGGGGGGGLITGTISALVGPYSIVVGAGGTGGTNSYTPGTGGGGIGSQGGNSSLFGLTAIGGGYGGTRSAPTGGNGGSGGGGGDGGGAGGAGTSGQGYAGGTAPAMNSNGGWDEGGGGGAGGAASSWIPGPGVSNSYSGTAVIYAKGGAGTAGGGTGVQAPVNTGQGGRGGATTADTTGGSGIVIIRYVV